MTPLESLRALGLGEEAPGAAKERVLAAVLLGVQATAAAGASGAAPVKGEVGAPVSSPVVASSATSVPFVTGKLVALGLGLWLLGGVAGAALYGSFRPASVKLVYVDRPVLRAPIISRTSTAPEASAASPLASIGAATGPRTANAAATPSRDSSELARERALLDLARKSSAHGDAAGALETAELHRSQFPKGRLAEEREALAIRALSSLGRGSEARERAQAFRAAYPNSFLTGIVEAAAAVP